MKILQHICVCGQGKTDYILEIVHFWMWIEEFLKGFFNVAR